MNKKNKKDTTESVPMNISISDLLLVDGFKEAMFKQDEATLKRILFTNGVDVTKPYEIKSVVHRNLRKQVVDGPMLFGYERLDKDWLRSGASSKEAMVASTNDLSLRQELAQMSREGQSVDFESQAKQYVISGGSRE